MKNQRDKLHQYQKRITIITDREKDIARTCLSRGDKPKALLALRRKKYQESLLAKTDAQLEQLEKLTDSVEFAMIQKDVLFGLQQGTAVLKQINTEMGGLDNIEKMMEEGEDARAYQQVGSFVFPMPDLSDFRVTLFASLTRIFQQEISEMLGGQMSVQDEYEVEEELDAMEQDIVGRDVVALPDVPHAQLPDSAALFENAPAKADKALGNRRIEMEA